MSDQTPAEIKARAVIRAKANDIAAMVGNSEQLVGKMQQIVLREVMNNELLVNCDVASIVDAALEAHSLDLEFSGTLQQCHLVPFRHKTRGYVAKVMLGYRGLVKLMHQGNPELLKVAATLVYEGEPFHITASELSHEPDPFGDPSRKILGVYALLTFANHTQWEVMSTAQIEEIRGMSKYGNGGPWKDHWPQMARKSVLRRIANYVPLTPAATEVISALDQNEFEFGGGLGGSQPVEVTEVASSGVEAARAALGTGSQATVEVEAVAEQPEAPTEEAVVAGVGLTAAEQIALMNEED